MDFGLGKAETMGADGYGVIRMARRRRNQPANLIADVISRQSQSQARHRGESDCHFHLPQKSPHITKNSTMIVTWLTTQNIYVDSAVQGRDKETTKRSNNAMLRMFCYCFRNLLMSCTVLHALILNTINATLTNSSGSISPTLSSLVTLTCVNRFS